MANLYCTKRRGQFFENGEFEKIRPVFHQFSVTRNVKHLFTRRYGGPCCWFYANKTQRTKLSPEARRSSTRESLTMLQYPNVVFLLDPPSFCFVLVVKRKCHNHNVDQPGCTTIPPIRLLVATTFGRCAISLSTTFGRKK